MKNTGPIFVYADKELRDAFVNVARATGTDMQLGTHRISYPFKSHSEAGDYQAYERRIGTALYRINVRIKK